MRKKLERIGKKAGLEKKEANSFMRLGILGLVTAALATILGGQKVAGAAETKAVPVNEPTVNLRERCPLVPEHGPCKAILEKYYYDAKAKNCKSFTYGGCGGVVPFESYEECERACINPQVEEPYYPASKYGAIGIVDFK